MRKKTLELVSFCFICIVLRKKQPWFYTWVCYYAHHRDRQHGHIVYLYNIGLYIWISMLLRWLRLCAITLFFAVISKNLGTHIAQISKTAMAHKTLEVNIPLLFNWTIQNLRAYTHPIYIPNYQCIPFTLVCDWKCPNEMVSEWTNEQKKKNSQPNFTRNLWSCHCHVILTSNPFECMRDLLSCMYIVYCAVYVSWSQLHTIK